ncbi:cupin domain-containing protein [Aliikangiella sp. G2MR2-5]|uniref:cupin domain-containing protein n=1 Tax=Aliikangiella sp. G2MR2-5 TaxID=2788943 RepID=UPI0018AC763E|nr:cupin domain-containing protein [Aliikangiella sp. G2MR2-5]
MTKPLVLRHFDKDSFLSNYWQKAPCLIKAGLSEIPEFICADELAGLSLEEEVESRIICSPTDNSAEHGKTQDGWKLQHGPFDENTFAKLPERNWTLLVQTIDFWIPETQQLVDLFNFIPRWRFDDLMVSYATQGGGVGPHYDNYDVFLVQGAGERRWQVGAKGKIPEEQKYIDGLKHLKAFKPEIDVIMQPGDILYIPPETAHWGVSVGESLGYSVGFRAPQSRDLFAMIANYLEETESNEFFEDVYRKKTNNSSCLEPELIKWAQDKINNLSKNQEVIKQILSNHLSQPKLESCARPPELPFPKFLKETLLPDQKLTLNPGSYFNWVMSEGRLIFSIDGETFSCPATFKEPIERLFSGESLEVTDIEAVKEKFAFSDLLASLVNKGYLIVTA